MVGISLEQGEAYERWMRSQRAAWKRLSELA